MSSGDGALEPIGDLVRRCLADDEEAVTELVNRFKGRVFALCRRMVDNTEDAEDLTQESMVRAVRSLRTWDPQRPFVPWLLAIAGNRCRSLLARRGHRAQPAPEGVLEAGRPLRPRSSAAELWHLTDELQAALGRIRLEHRQAFLLFHKEELSYEEIAAALQRPVGTVKTWVHRARRDLIEHFVARGVTWESGHGLRRV